MSLSGVKKIFERIECLLRWEMSRGKEARNIRCSRRRMVVQVHEMIPRGEMYDCCCGGGWGAKSRADGQVWLSEPRVMVSFRDLGLPLSGRIYSTV